MPQKKHKPEETVAKLRQVDVLVLQGQSVAEIQSKNRPAQCIDENLGKGSSVVKHQQTCQIFRQKNLMQGGLGSKSCRGAPHSHCVLIFHFSQQHPALHAITLRGAATWLDLAKPYSGAQKPRRASVSPRMPDQ